MKTETVFHLLGYPWWLVLPAAGMAVALALWLFVPWAWWVDKHRTPIVRIDAATASYQSAL